MRSHYILQNFNFFSVWTFILLNVIRKYQCYYLLWNQVLLRKHFFCVRLKLTFIFTCIYVYTHKLPCKSSYSTKICRNALSMINLIPQRSTQEFFHLMKAVINLLGLWGASDQSTASISPCMCSGSLLLQYKKCLEETLQVIFIASWKTSTLMESGQHLINNPCREDKQIKQYYIFTHSYDFFLLILWAFFLKGAFFLGQLSMGLTSRESFSII